jgi:hypothetical protein
VVIAIADWKGTNAPACKKTKTMNHTWAGKPIPNDKKINRRKYRHPIGGALMLSKELILPPIGPL